MENKLLLKSLVELYGLSLRLSHETEQIAANAEHLSNCLDELLERINPVHNDLEELDSWENYKERTLNYVNGGN